jgi:hypothetical protein
MLKLKGGVKGLMNVFFGQGVSQRVKWKGFFFSIEQEKIIETERGKGLINDFLEQGVLQRVNLEIIT